MIGQIPTIPISHIGVNVIENEDAVRGAKVDVFIPHDLERPIWSGKTRGDGFAPITLPVPRKTRLVVRVEVGSRTATKEIATGSSPGDAFVEFAFERKESGNALLVAGIVAAVVIAIILSR